MKLEDRLLPIARRWHGVIPTWEARNAGIDDSQLRHWALGNPDVDHPERGIYVWWTDDEDVNYEYTHLAQTLASAGEGATLWGPTVVELHGLGAWASPVTHIATYVRKRPKEGVRWHHDTGYRRETAAGLPSQGLNDALAASLPFMDEDKRQAALADAMERNILTKEHADELLRS